MVFPKINRPKIQCGPSRRSQLVGRQLVVRWLNARHRLRNAVSSPFQLNLNTAPEKGRGYGGRELAYPKILWWRHLRLNASKCWWYQRQMMSFCDHVTLWFTSAKTQLAPRNQLTRSNTCQATRVTCCLDRSEKTSEVQLNRKVDFWLLHCKGGCNLLAIYSVSDPPEFIFDIFPNGWKFLDHILHTYCTFLSTLVCNFLFNYLQLWRSYAILSATTISL